MHIQSTEVIDTFAEAFAMWGARVIITAATPAWALAAARSMTGFATSVIGCKCEAGIERELSAEETPDARPGISVLLFSTSLEGAGKRLLERIGQCVMTCPSTSCFNGLTSGEGVSVGGKLRFFGDGYQIAKSLDGRRYWRIPVMDGEFVVEDRFNIQPAVGGGNLLIHGLDQTRTLETAEAAASAMRTVPGVILPFPNGVVRSGSKIGSRYKGLPASTNDAYCPTLRAFSAATEVPLDAACVLEIVIDGLELRGVQDAMRVGINAASGNGTLRISAGNYGGDLGQYRIGLYDLLQAAT